MGAKYEGGLCLTGWCGGAGRCCAAFKTGGEKKQQGKADNSMRLNCGEGVGGYGVSLQTAAICKLLVTRDRADIVDGEFMFTRDHGECGLLLHIPTLPQKPHRYSQTYMYHHKNVSYTEDGIQRCMIENVGRVRALHWGARPRARRAAAPL